MPTILSFCFCALTSILAILKCLRIEIVENYVLDLDNPDAHGQFLADICTEERIGKKQASCIVVARPNTTYDEVPLLKATFTDDTITIEGPSKASSWMEHAQGKDGWMNKLQKHQKRFHATKLGSVLTSLTTKLKKKTRT